MAKLDLVVGQAIKPAIAASDLSLRSLERAATRAGLPSSFVENPAGIVPLHAVEHFLALLQLQVGSQDFLFRSLELDLEERRQTHSIVGIPLPTGLTNVEALNGLTGTFNMFISGARFLCERQKNLFWIMRTSSATDWSDEWPTLQYNLAIMQTATRRILGRDMSPLALALPRIPEKNQLPDMLYDIPTILLKDRFGMAFDLFSVVGRRFMLSGTARAEPGDWPDTIDPELLPAVASCISEYLGSPTEDRLSDRVASAFGLSSRTYRRRLSELGTTHAELLSDVRLKLALTRLADKNCSVIDVAVELGYAHPGDFTRFFKRRMGITPAEFRQIDDAPGH